MARKSRWQQFTDSFNSMYGTVTGIGQDFEIAKVNRQDFKDDAGNPLEGLALDRARTKALGDIYTKYGDAEKGISLRSSAEGLGSMSRENDIGEATKVDQIYQKGAGATGLLNANISNTNMNTANTGSIMNQREVLLPGELVGQRLGNEELSLGNEYARKTMGWRVDTAESEARTNAADAAVAEGTVGSRITQSEAEAGDAANQEVISGLEADRAVVSQDDAVKALVTELQAKAAEAESKILSAETVARDRSIAQDIYQQVVADSIEAGEELDDTTMTVRYLEALQTSDMTIESRAHFGKLMSEIGALNLGEKVVQRRAEAEKVLSEQGLGALVNLLDGVDVDAEPVENPDGTFSVIADRGDGLPEVMLTAQTEAELAAATIKLFSDPGTLADIVINQYENEQKRANTSETQTRTEFLQAQIDETLQAIENSGGSISKEREIAMRGLATLMSSDGYLLLLDGDPEAARAMQMEFMKTFGLLKPTTTGQNPNNGVPEPAPAQDKPPVKRPANVSQATWDLLSDREKELFRK